MSTRLSFWLLLMTGLAIFASSPAAHAQAPAAKSKGKPSVTTVYLVRHAEKDTANAADPVLSAIGQVRALSLRQTLVRHHPVALFTTDTKRTRATLAPLADATKLEPQVYDAKQSTALAVRILKEYAGKTVVVVGHSNTLLPLIESLGATPPVEEIADDEYDYLFTVRIAEGTPPTVAVQGYGPERKLVTAPKADAKTPSPR